MRYAKVIATLVCLGCLLMVGLRLGPALPDAAADAAFSTAPFPTPTVSAEPAAAPALIAAALKCERRAYAALREYARAAACLGHAPHLRLSGRPPRLAAAAVWLDRAHRWRAQRRAFVVRTFALVQRMRHPGGSASGAKWLPLARFVGWPAATLSHLAAIIMRESSSRPWARNPSGCTGLLQIWPGHVSDPAHLTDPEYNLRVGLRLYREAGWAPWAL